MLNFPLISCFSSYKYSAPK